MTRILPLVIIAAIARAASADELALRNWPAFRGPLATGEAPAAGPPIEWSEKKNIRWKLGLPGNCHATPIIWNDRIYIQTVVETDKEASGSADRGDVGPAPPQEHLFDFQVIAVDRKSGKILWTTTVRETVPHEGASGDGAQASNSPVTDGENIFAYFGSRGLHCLSLDGKVKWSVDLGRMKTKGTIGEGSSPALFGDTIIINWDHEGDDFIVAIDKNTGKEKWRKTRDEHTTWSTPLIVQAEGKPQVVVSATNQIKSYDLATGAEIWRCKGMTASVVPSPMAAGDLLYAISGYKGAACLAIRFAAAHGDISGTDRIAWKYDQDTPYTSSALLMNERLYFVDYNHPLLTCLDARTGRRLFGKSTLDGVEDVHASILGAHGHVYVVGSNGTTVVLKDGPEFKLVSTNKLDDEFNASPVAAGKELFLRGAKYLYCLAE